MDVTVSTERCTGFCICSNDKSDNRAKWAVIAKRVLNLTEAAKAENSGGALSGEHYER